MMSGFCGDSSGSFRGPGWARFFSVTGETSYLKRLPDRVEIGIIPSTSHPPFSSHFSKT